MYTIESLYKYMYFQSSTFRTWRDFVSNMRFTSLLKNHTNRRRSIIFPLPPNPVTVHCESHTAVRLRCSTAVDPVNTGVSAVPVVFRRCIGGSRHFSLCAILGLGLGSRTGAAVTVRVGSARSGWTGIGVGFGVRIRTGTTRTWSRITDGWPTSIRKNEKSNAIMLD